MLRLMATVVQGYVSWFRYTSYMQLHPSCCGQAWHVNVETKLETGTQVDFDAQSSWGW